ncbi:DoxX family protein [Soonwooa purpurea]
MKLISSETNPSLVNVAALILRLFVGFSMLTHGYPKLEKLMGNGEIQFMDFLGLGPIITLVLVVIAEVICSVFIILGFLTRFASSVLIMTMLIAIFMAHGADPYSGKEMAVLYLFHYIVLMLIGPGRFSIDQLFTKKKIRY